MFFDSIRGMKLITLNIWRGSVFEPLIAFVKKYSAEVDIFCFQEVFNNPPGKEKRVLNRKPRLDIYTQLQKALPDFASYTHPAEDYDESLALFVKKTITVEAVGEEFVYRYKNAMENGDPSTSGVNVEYIRFVERAQHYTVCNLHGHWEPGGSGDSPARLEQSRNIQKLLGSIDGAKILCGDFNMAPNTRSMHIIEEGMSNLTTKHGVVTTRSSLHAGKQNKIVDYILVSSEVTVNDFKVLPDEVSDHLALYLDFV